MHSCRSLEREKVGKVESHLAAPCGGHCICCALIRFEWNLRPTECFRRGPEDCMQHCRTSMRDRTALNHVTNATSQLCDFDFASHLPKSKCTLPERTSTCKAVHNPRYTDPSSLCLVRRGIHHLRRAGAQYTHLQATHQHTKISCCDLNDSILLNPTPRTLLLPPRSRGPSVLQLSYRHISIRSKCCNLHSPVACHSHFRVGRTFHPHPSSSPRCAAAWSASSPKTAPVCCAL